MERPVKERLVGAAVLMAAAIILIPEMLSGPKRKDVEPAPIRDGALKTYTIDLNRSPGTQATVEIEEPAPPPEMVAPAVEAELSSEAPPSEQLARPQASPESEVPAIPNPAATEAARRSPAQEAPQTRAESQPPVTREQSASRSAPIVSAPTVPTSRGWAVQLGSFASKATADRLAKDQSGSGHDAFVMPVRSGATTLYRVRIGPFADRAAANDALRAVKGRVANAAVVVHP